MRPKHGCLTTLTVFTGLIVAWIIIGILTRTQNHGYASADNVKRFTNIEFPAYKVKWTKRYWGFDGFEHQISLKFKDMPQESFYSLLNSLCEDTYTSNSSIVQSWPWKYENDYYCFSLNHSPHNITTSDFLKTIGYSQEYLDRHNISISIKIPKNQKEWSLYYSESI